MYDFAYSVQVVKTYQALFSHDSHQRHGSAFVVVSLNDFKQVDAKDLEYHHEVLPVRAMVQETVK